MSDISRTKRLVVSAVLLALATVLSMVKIVHLPFGGSITLLSMFPIFVLSIKYGTKWGLFAAFIFSLIRLLISLGTISGYAVSPVAFVGAIIFDYIVPYTSLGLAGIFVKEEKPSEICFGIILAVSLRFLSHCISGVLFFRETLPQDWNPILWAVCYNGATLLPETVVTAIFTIVLCKLPVFKKIK